MTANHLSSSSAVGKIRRDRSFFLTFPMFISFSGCLDSLLQNLSGSALQRFANLQTGFTSLAIYNV
ncbi:MAG: hypothetical protein ACFB0E_07680 [Leptolyngbyaceae cyanobacterium]